jgi:uncharacterized protein YegP (UPF0339 family)
MADMLVEVFKRSDGKWGWHAIAKNRQLVASDAGQGYENRADAEDMMHRVMGGEYAAAGPLVADPGMEVLVPLVRQAVDDAFANATPDLEMASRYIAGAVRKAVWQAIS